MLCNITLLILSTLQCILKPYKKANTNYGICLCTHAVLQVWHVSEPRHTTDKICDWPWIWENYLSLTKTYCTRQ